MSEAVPVGAVLQFAVSMPKHVGDLFLVGEVRWCQRRDDSWLAGFEVLNAEGSDIDTWIVLIESLEE